MLVMHDIEQNCASGKKQIAVLIDPDKLTSEEQITKTIGMVNASGVDLIFYGGSLISGDNFNLCLERIKQLTDIPVLLFPGSALQVSSKADAILFLSLISGRNPEFLIGQQVLAAPAIKASGIEVIPTGYLLIDSGRATTASYVSNTQPIPHNKPEIAATTALAGEMLGMKLIYLDGGSGAQYAITNEMIEAVKKQISLPLIVGGGINSPEEMLSRFEAGADIVVVGTAAENDPFILRDMVCALHEK
jgi:phosphoglycerol geranylgeranyltransferase